MKATDVYHKNRRDIKIITDAMRKRGVPGHITTPDGTYIFSAQPFEPDIEILSTTVVGTEFVGAHTNCQVKPSGMRDLRMICVQTMDNKAKHLQKCIEPIGEDILFEITEIALEQDPVVKDLIYKTRNGKMSIEEASKEYNRRLATSLGHEKQMLDYYNMNRDKLCGRIDKLRTVIETKGSKVIETETQDTKTINL